MQTNKPKLLRLRKRMQTFLELFFLIRKIVQPNPISFYCKAHTGPNKPIKEK